MVYGRNADLVLYSDDLASIAPADRIGDVHQWHRKQAALDAGHEQVGGGGLHRGGDTVGDRTAELIEPCIGGIGSAPLAQRGGITSRRDGLALIRHVTDINSYATLDDWQEKAVCQRDQGYRPCCRRSASGADISFLAECRALIEYPVMPAAGQRLRGIVVLKDRIVGDEDRAGRAGEDVRRPVDRRWSTAEEAADRETRTVDAFSPRYVLAEKHKRRRGRNDSLRPCAHTCVALLSHQVTSLMTQKVSFPAQPR